MEAPKPAAHSKAHIASSSNVGSDAALLDYIAAQIKAYVQSSSIVWLAYSGGMDSQVLLHAVFQLKKTGALTQELKVIHVHHGLSDKADQWSDFCEQVAGDYQIPCMIHRVTLATGTGESVEAMARKARYDIFASIMQPSDLLLTAHHERDQAETVLLRLLRGAGPEGLAAMLPAQSFANGHLLRPLLSIPFRKIQSYAVEQSLVWVEDHSNADMRFDRNFIRHQLLPLLETRWPAAQTSLVKTSRHCANVREVFADWYAQRRDSACLRGGLSIAYLKTFSPALQMVLLRGFLAESNCLMPSTEQLANIERTILNARSGTKPLFQLPTYSLRRDRDVLYVLKQAQEPDSVA